MRRSMWFWWICLPPLLILLALGWGAARARAQTVNQLAAGESVSGEVTNRLGDEWSFYGCGGDVITLTMQSADFSAFIELYGPTGRASLTSASADAADEPATISALTLAEPGSYTVVAAGVSIRDRGRYSLTLTLSDTMTAGAAADLAMIEPGIPVSGTVQDRLGEEWFFRGCAQEQVTITMHSADFNPFLALYGPTGREALVDTAGDVAGNESSLDAFSLPENGLYTIVAAGQSIRARGDYTLALTVRTPLTSTATTTPIATPTRSATATTQAAICTVVSSSLNLRPGPGANYEPAIGLLSNGAQLLMQARNSLNTWIQVRVVGSGQVGWVSSAAQFVDCTADVATLPLGVIPPTPTAAPVSTFTPTPSPTATPPPQAPPPPPRLDPTGILVPAPPGDPGDLAGDVYTNARDNFFTDRIYFEMYVWDPRAGNNLGDGIDHVDFVISCPDGDTYERTERDPRYCSFGGGEPDCNVVRLRAGENFPDSNCGIETGDYHISITAFPRNNNRRSGNWNFDFSIDVGNNNGAGNGANSPQAGLQADIAQIGPGSRDTTVHDALVFQVVAFDPNRGNRDGDGIRNVDMWIEGPDGRRVYSRTENNAAYCAFAGGEPDCNVFDLRNNDNWPDDGPLIEDGPHRLRAIIHAEDGRQTELDQRIELQR